MYANLSIKIKKPRFKCTAECLTKIDDFTIKIN